LLSIGQIHVEADSIDKAHEKELNCTVDEVLVLSRHVSNTNTPAITLHAVGLPGVIPMGERGKAGGINGVLVPPSPRFATIFREMLVEARKRKLDDHFDLTLEATHHGPVLETPTLYVEIGSTEADWSRDDALNLWAYLISKILGLKDGIQMGLWEGDGEVMIGLGGGHYSPRHRAVLEKGDMWLGHIIASYSLDFSESESLEDDETNHPWQEAILSAVNSTKKSFPGGQIFVHMDRKSFKGWQRKMIESFLSKRGIPLRRGKDITGG
jgi:D-aminoacyl-tRNA deacylase